MKKRTELYWFFRNLVSANSKAPGKNVSTMLAENTLSVKYIKRVFRDEVKNLKPNYSVLVGCLNIFFTIIKRYSRFSFYELIDVLPFLVKCFIEDRRKTTRRLSSEVIAMLFGHLFRERRLMNASDYQYVDSFKTIISKEKLLKILEEPEIKKNKYFIFRECGIDLGLIIEKKMNDKLKQFVDDFYSVS